jgi:hypothetical protein
MILEVPTECGWIVPPINRRMNMMQKLYRPSTRQTIENEANTSSAPAKYT